MKVRTAATLVFLLLVALVPAVTAAAQDSGVSIQLLDGPPDQAEDPRARLYIVDAANPGARLERRIRVTNRSDTAATLQVYPVAATAVGGWVVEEGRSSNDLTSWMTVAPSSVQLGPGEATQVTVTIQIPGDAEGGERYAAVAVEAPPVSQGASTVIGRVALRTYIYVTGDEASPPVTDFDIDTLTAGRDAAGTPYVRIGISNTGTRAIDVNGELVLEDGPGGVSAGPFPVVLGQTLAPGESGSLDVVLDADLPAGPWLARADLVSGRVERSAEAVISFPSDRDEEGVAVEAAPVYRDRGVLLPLALVLVLLTFLLVAGTWYARKWRLRDRTTTV